MLDIEEKVLAFFDTEQGRLKIIQIADAILREKVITPPPQCN